MAAGLAEMKLAVMLERRGGPACRDTGSTLSARFALRSCGIVTAEVLKVWSWDQQQRHLVRKANPRASPQAYWVRN